MTVSSDVVRVDLEAFVADVERWLERRG